MYSRIRKIKLTNGILLLLLVTSNKAIARDEGDEFDNLLSLSLNELLNTPITTSSFYTENDLEAGSSVSVILPKYWQDRGARRLDDALSYMPGVAILPTFIGTKQWVVRGYPNSNATGVQTLWDGVPLNSYPTGSAQADHPNIQLNTLSSIEVIRGPGSALYGSDALHGVVSLKAYESETDEQTGRLRAASNGYYEAAVNSSFGLASNWRANIAISSNGQPDQDFEYTYIDTGVEKIAERDYNYNNLSTSIKISSDPARGLSYSLGLYFNDYEHDGFYHNGSNVPSNDNSFADSQLGIIKAGSKYIFSPERSLSFDISYLEYEREFSRFLPQPLASPDKNRNHIFADEDKINARLLYKDEKLFDNTEASFAIEHKKDEVESAHVIVNSPTGAVLNSFTLFFSEQGRTINSFLFDGKTHFSDKTNIFRYGFRYDDYSDFGTQFTPRLGLIHHLNESKVVKLLYGNSFRAPSGNELFGAPLFSGNLNLEPEELDSLELVYISKNESSKVEAILFANEWTNGIILDGTNTFANASENSSAGIELSYVRQYTDWLLDVNGSFIESKNDTDNLDYTIFPTYIFNLALGYQFKNNWVMTLNNRLMLDVTRVQDDGTNSPEKLPDYIRTDINFTKSYTSNLNVFVNIRNLFNRANELPSVQDTGLGLNEDFATGIEEEEISLDAGVSFSF